MALSLRLNTIQSDIATFAGQWTQKQIALRH
jgi:hypothetical protein